MKLNSKNTIVTGAASGIGRGIAQRFAQEGANVVCADLDEEGLATVAAGIGGVAVGLVVGGAAYMPTVRFVRFSRRRMGRLRAAASKVRGRVHLPRRRR